MTEMTETVGIGIKWCYHRWLDEHPCSQPPVILAYFWCEKGTTVFSQDAISSFENDTEGVPVAMGNWKEVARKVFLKGIKSFTRAKHKWSEPHTT
jgi:hypothetical protein